MQPSRIRLHSPPLPPKVLQLPLVEYTAYRLRGSGAPGLEGLYVVDNQLGVCLYCRMRCLVRYAL